MQGGADWKTVWQLLKRWAWSCHKTRRRPPRCLPERREDTVHTRTHEGELTAATERGAAPTAASGEHTGEPCSAPTTRWSAAWVCPAAVTHQHAPTGSQTTGIYFSRSGSWTQDQGASQQMWRPVRAHVLVLRGPPSAPEGGKWQGRSLRAP